MGSKGEPLIALAAAKLLQAHARLRRHLAAHARRDDEAAREGGGVSSRRQTDAEEVSRAGMSRLAENIEQLLSKARQRRQESPWAAQVGVAVEKLMLLMHELDPRTDKDKEDASAAAVSQGASGMIDSGKLLEKRLLRDTGKGGSAHRAPLSPVPSPLALELVRAPAFFFQNTIKACESLV